MFHSDLDKLTAKMPPWAMAVTNNGVRYAVRQPNIAEEEQLANVATMKDGQIINLMWSLLAGPKVPDKTLATRDTLTMFFTQLLLYQKARQAMQREVLKSACDRVRSAVVAVVHPASTVAQSN